MRQAWSEDPPPGKNGDRELNQGLRQGTERQPRPAVSPPAVDRGRGREDKRTTELEGPKPGLCHSDDKEILPVAQDEARNHPPHLSDMLGHHRLLNRHFSTSHHIQTTWESC